MSNWSVSITVLIQFVNSNGEVNDGSQALLVPRYTKHNTNRSEIKSSLILE